eukprot:g18728.t1
MAKKSQKSGPNVLFETTIGFVDTHKGRGAAKLIDLCFELPGKASVLFPIKFCSFKRVSSTVRDDEFNLVTRGWSQTQGYRLWIEPIGREGNFLRVNVGTITERRPHFVICEMKYRLVLTEAMNVHEKDGAPDVFPVPPPGLQSPWTLKLAMNEQAMRLDYHDDAPQHVRHTRTLKGRGYTPQAKKVSRRIISKAKPQKGGAAGNNSAERTSPVVKRRRAPGAKGVKPPVKRSKKSSFDQQADADEHYDDDETEPGDEEGEEGQEEERGEAPNGNAAGGGGLLEFANLLWSLKEPKDKGGEDEQGGSLSQETNSSAVKTESEAASVNTVSSPASSSSLSSSSSSSSSSISSSSSPESSSDPTSTSSSSSSIPSPPSAAEQEKSN